MKSVFVVRAIAMVAMIGVSMAATDVHAEPGSERAAGTPGATKDVVATAVEAGHFKTLAKALEAAGLVETLKGALDYFDMATTGSRRSHARPSPSPSSMSPPA